ncbi:MAG: phosphate ABC transporter, permease protein PstA, partial [Cyanobacteria bacterium J06633_23]
MTAQGIQDKNVATSNFKQDLSGRYNLDKIFATAAWTATIVSVLVLAWLLFTILVDGLGGLNWNFLNAFPSR